MLLRLRSIRLLHRTSLVLLLAGICFCLSCSQSDWTVRHQEPLVDVTGRYEANVNGPLTMVLIKLGDERSNVFRGTMDRGINGGIAESIGVGTYADRHLILNFDRGLDTEYYFEGFFDFNPLEATTLTGQFTLPGGGAVPAEFEFSGIVIIPGNGEEPEDGEE